MKLSLLPSNYASYKVCQFLHDFISGKPVAEILWYFLRVPVLSWSSNQGFVFRIFVLFD